MRSAATQRHRSKTGNAVEAMIEAQHDAMAAARIAYLYKVGTPVKFTRRDGKLEAVHTKKTTCDYLGMTAADGKHIAVECKHVAARKLASGKAAPPSLAPSRIEPQQALMLERVMLAGGIAIVLVVYNHGEAIFSVPWKVARVDGGLRGQWLQMYRVPKGALYLRGHL